MRFVTKGLVGIASAVLPLSALGQVSSIGPFTGQLQEGWETQGTGFQTQWSMFNNTAQAVQLVGTNSLNITTGWSFFSFIGPHGGTHLMGGAGANYEFVFNTPATQFGGYFGTNADTADAVATFYDNSGNQIGGPLPVSAPLGNWAWNGWSYAGGIKAISIVANNQFTGFIMSDDLQYSAVPEPASLAALGLGALTVLRRRRR